MEGSSQPVDHLCFSSQYFFILTLYATGMVFLMLGMQTIIAADYNPYNDVAAYYTIVIFILICLVVYYVTLFVGKTLRIWRVVVEDCKRFFIKDLELILLAEEASFNIKSEDMSFYDAGRLNMITKYFICCVIGKIFITDLLKIGRTQEKLTLSKRGYRRL